MLIEDLSNLIVEQKAFESPELKRLVLVDFYLPKNVVDPSSMSLLLINDGQDLQEMPFPQILNALLESNQIGALLCVGIHAGHDRRNEYGTSGVLDYDGRGVKTLAYETFIIEHLLPQIHDKYRVEKFKSIGYAGFSLGGLTALDLSWKHPDIFSTVGVFSGSLWWRSKPLGKDYNDDTDRIMHQLIRGGKYHPGLRFYFTTGSLDESADRNNNGIIDSIDDTLDLMKELENHGYQKDGELKYINYEEGRHDVATWGKAMPAFLLWGWSLK